MEKMMLPPIAVQMIGDEEVGVKEVGSFDLSDPSICDKIADLFKKYCILSSRDSYSCVEKNDIPALIRSNGIVATSFICFGVGLREKKWTKTIVMEVNDYCCHRRQKRDGKVFIYYLTISNGDRYIALVATR